MRFRAASLLVLALAALVPAHAEQTRRERTAPAPATAMPCVEVRIGNDSAGRLDCLNRALRAEVDKTAPMVAGDPASGMSPTRLGQPTPAELKERLGSTYGHSVVPQRPPRTFVSPFVPVR